MLGHPRKAIPVLLSSILVACGGGGGDTTVASSQPTAPASAGTATGGTSGTPTGTGTGTGTGTQTTTPTGTSDSTSSSAGSGTTGASAPAPTPAPASIPASSSAGSPAPAPAPASGSTPTPAPAATPAPTTANYDQTARFIYPARIARDGAGNVYVEDLATQDALATSYLWIGSDTGSERIRKIAPNGDVTTLPGTYQRIVGMAASGENLYVATMRPNTPTAGSSAQSATDIVKVAPDGTRTTLATYLIGPGTSNPISLDADALGHVYVTTNYRQIFSIDRIDPDGTKKLVYNFSTFGSFFDVATDAQGTLTVSLSQPDRTNYLVTIPLSAQPAAQSTNPGGATSIPSAPGVTVRQVSFGGRIGYDAAGKLYIFSVSSSIVDPGSVDKPEIDRLTAITLQRQESDGTLTTVYNGVPDGVTTQYTGRYPIDFVLAPNGDAYITLSLDHTVYKITGNGQASLVAGKNGEVGTSD